MSGTCCSQTIRNRRELVWSVRFLLAYRWNLRGLGRNTLLEPGVLDLDLALEKCFPLHEQVNPTFRAEACHFTNHPKSGLPNVTVPTSSGTANPAAGVTTHTRTSSWQFQFAIRIN
jgi:hypothetical protein